MSPIEIISMLYAQINWMQEELDRTEIEAQKSGFLALVSHELKRARKKHPTPLHSHHEAYAVVLEELDEVWAEVKAQKADPERIRAELIQVAAMCARWAEDVCGKGQA